MCVLETKVNVSNTCCKCGELLIEMKLKDPEIQRFATPGSAALSSVTLCDLCAEMRVVG